MISTKEIYLFCLRNTGYLEKKTHFQLFYKKELGSIILLERGMV